VAAVVEPLRLLLVVFLVQALEIQKIQVVIVVHTFPVAHVLVAVVLEDPVVGVEQADQAATIVLAITAVRVVAVALA
jgi:hypothetical protein